MKTEDKKKAAAIAALKFVKSGQKIGLGTGSTANYFIEGLAKLVTMEKLFITCVPTSQATSDLATKLGLKVSNLEQTPFLDLTVDGADEVSPTFQLIKGGGGAMHREKLVASSSKYMVAIIDDSKTVDVLGKFPLPIEVSKFGVQATAWKIERTLESLKLKGQLTLRRVGDKPFITESGNAIIDCAIGAIPEPEKLDSYLNNIAGVIETGLFINICGIIMVSGNDGVKEFVRGS